MSNLDRSQLRPPYPEYSEKGIQPEPYPYGPPDLRPSGLGPGYSVYASAHGRNLAGMDNSNFDRKNSEGIETYPNELNMLSQFDDVDGNGVFDPNDSHGNVHPEEGIFQDHVNLPGYIARDKFYAQSEVSDLTKPNGYTMYVPGGAVSFQQGQQRTFEKNELLWDLPPSVSPYQADPTDEQSIVEAPTATWPVSGAEDAKRAQKVQYYLFAAGAGLAVGVAAIYLMRRK